MSGTLTLNRSLRIALISIIAPMALSVAIARADEPVPAPPAEVTPAEPAADPTWDTLLTGTWGGLRPRLKDEAGLQLNATYISEVLSNVGGGLKSGTIYDGRLEMVLDWDLKSIGWNGAAFHANAYQIHGRGLSANYLDNLNAASSIEAQRTTRLYDLWLEQSAGPASLRAGRIAADEEFLISQTASVFVNATFGWPTIAAADLPDGGPAYPLAAPGARLKLTPRDDVTLLAAVFSGNSAGAAGPGTAQSRDLSGTNFAFHNGVLAMTEASYAANQGKDSPGLPGTYKLGAWYLSGRVADQRFDTAGRSLADPASTGVARQHSQDFGLYAVVDQMLWRREDAPDQGLSGFTRIVASPQSDRNLVNFYLDGGLSWKGLVAEARDDILALAVGYARIGDRAAALDGDARVFSGRATPIRDMETVVELTYQYQATPWWTLQPDLQFIINPGGGIPDPHHPGSSSAIPDATVIGLRSSVKF